MRRTLVFAVALVMAAGFLAGLHLDLYWLRMVTKPLPVLLFALFPASSPTGRLVVAGLVLSAAGDVLLELEPERFVAGLVAFLLAHVAYTAAFLAESRASRPLLALPFLAYGATALAILWPGLGDMALPVTVYVVVICAMMWRAAARIGPRPAARLAWLGLAGAVSFALSDTLIAVNRFFVPVPAADHLIILTYWAGQAGIALSVTTAPATGSPPGGPPGHQGRSEGVSRRLDPR